MGALGKCGIFESVLSGLTGPVLKGERCDDTPPGGDLINHTGNNVLCRAFGLGKLGEHAIYKS